MLWGGFHGSVFECAFDHRCQETTHGTSQKQERQRWERSRSPKAVLFRQEEGTHHQKPNGRNAKKELNMCLRLRQEAQLMTCNYYERSICWKN